MTLKKDYNSNKKHTKKTKKARTYHLTVSKSWRSVNIGKKVICLNRYEENIRLLKIIFKFENPN